MLLGWEKPRDRLVGFSSGEQPEEDSRVVQYKGEGPVCVVAPTGAGKGRDFLIPNLLTHWGPAIVVDPKGELYNVTSRRRREMGQKVAVLDPFGKTSAKSDSLSPLDIFSVPGSVVECDAEMLASQLSLGHEFGTDPFWNDTGTGLISGLIAHIASAHPPEERNLGTLRSYLADQDLEMRLAKILDKKEYRHELVRDEFAAYLVHSSDRTQACVRSTATTYVKVLGSEPVARGLGPSTIDPAAVVAGHPLTVYIVIPPDKLRSHRSLLRLWVGTLLTLVMRRSVVPEKRTLFVLDEAAQLGTFDPLLVAATLLRGYGLQLVTIWQDLSQIKARYPHDWKTILNNSGAILAFGFGHYGMANEWGEEMGMSPESVLRMDEQDAVLSVRGEGTKVVKRLNYLRDSLFRGLADQNPLFGGRDRGR
jgi:type IV secretion system protein VirD4